MTTPTPKPRRVKKSPKPRRARVKAVKAWAGVIEDQIDMKYGPIYAHAGRGMYTAGLFRTRAQAKAAYECVIPVTITPRRPANGKR